MRYDFTELIGCDRLSVSGIRGITVRPNSRIQMILGMNGAGKSSLMELAFTPFAPSKDFFPNGGSWTVGITHRGVAYTLSATYTDKVHYSFKDGNGEELNRSRNITSQDTLIIQYFGMTRELQDLMLGKVILTELGPQARRDWMARLSSSDFGFAFKALKHYTKRHSYFKSVSEFLTKRINEEKERLIQEEDLAEMMGTRQRLQEEYDGIQSSYNYPIDESKVPSFDRLKRLSTEIIEGADKLLLSSPTSPSLLSDEEYQSAIALLTEQSNAASGQEEMVIDEITTLQQAIGRIDHLAAGDTEELIRQEAELDAMLSELPEIVGIPTSYLGSAGKAIESIRYVMATLPSERMDPAEALRVNREFESRLNLIAKANATLENIESSLEMMKGVGDVKCPSCQHNFKPGIDPELFEKLNQRRLTGMEYIKEQESLNAQIADLLDLDRRTQACAAELEMVRETYLRESPGLFNWLDSIGGWGIGVSMDVHLQRYESSYVLYHRREHLREKLEQVRSAVQTQSKINHELPQLQQQLFHLHQRKDEISKRQESYTADYRRLTTEYASIKAVESGTQSIVGLEISLFEEIDLYLQSCHNANRRSELQRVTGNIAVLENAINENDVIKTAIRDFEKSLVENKLLEQGAKAIVDELSPKTGLIAEQIKQQIGTVLNAMNSVIRKIWGYDLKIGIGEVGEGGLDYKFPLSVAGTPRRDISEGSSSMKEIINRAFVITAMICLGMEDYPMYQDEPAITFDTTHGLNFIPMVKELIDTDKFSQLIMISHDIDTQTAFNNAEYIILGDMELPHIPIANEHVEFHYTA